MDETIIRKGAAAALAVIAILQMSPIIEGSFTHEAVGAVFFLLALMHLGMNSWWFKKSFTGVFHGRRAFLTVIDLLLLADVIGLAVSSPFVSMYLFNFLDLDGALFGRRLHLLTGTWAIILMGAHFGAHLTYIRESLADREIIVPNWITAALWGASAVLGAASFYDLKLIDYLTLDELFVFFDDAKPPILFYAEYAAVFLGCAALSDAAGLILAKLAPKPVKDAPVDESRNAMAKSFCVVLAIAVIALFSELVIPEDLFGAQGESSEQSAP